MNLILFTTDETARPLAASDPRARHVLETLRRKPGDTFDAGLVDGPQGKARLEKVDAAGLHLSFRWGPPPPPLPRLTLIVGLPRPQTARDVLRDATTLGVTAMHFVATAKSESSYAQSSLWQDGEWRRHLLAGAQQAFDTRLPEVSRGRPLGDVLAALPAGGTRLALDNYEAAAPLATAPLPAADHAVVAIGPERGWDAADRELLRRHGFLLVHLGPRVLRTETACVAALSLAKARLGWA